MNLDQRIFVLEKSNQGKKRAKMKDEYERTFGTPCPTRRAIIALVRKFAGTASLLHKKGAGRPRNPLASVDRIEELVSNSPRVSLRTHERQSGILRSTLQRRIKGELKKRSYHIQVVHRLYPRDRELRTEMCTELLRLWRTEDLGNNILFSDEAIFHISAKINKHNCRM